MEKAAKLVFKKLDNGLPIQVALDNLPDDFIKRYGMELICRGADPEKVAGLLSPESLAVNLGLLLEAGVPPDFLAERVHTGKLETLQLLKIHGATPKVLIGRLFAVDPESVAANLKWLSLNGFFEEIDLEKLISKELPVSRVLANLEQLLWASPRAELVLRRLASIYIAERLDLFFAAGVTAEELKKYLKPYEILVHSRWLVQHGAEVDPNEVLGKLVGGINNLSSESVEDLLLLGADPFKLAGEMSQELFMRNLELLSEYGLDFDHAQRLFTPDNVILSIDRFSNMGRPIPKIALVRAVRVAGRGVVWENFQSLLDAGIEISDLFLNIESQDMVLSEYIEQIVSYEPLECWEKCVLMRRCPKNALLRNFDILKEYDFPIDVDDLLEGISDAELEKNLGVLLKYGADIDVVGLAKRQRFDRFQYSANLEALLAAGVDPDFLANRICVSTLADHLDLLLEYDANPNILALLLLDYWSVDEEKLLAHGANLWLE